VANIQNVILEIFNENLKRGKELLCKSLMKSQQASPSFTHVYAALVAVINTKLPETIQLLLHRLVHSFQKAY